MKTKQCFGLVMLIAGLVLIACSTVKDLTAASINGEWDIIELKGEAVQPGEGTPFIKFDTENKRLSGFTGCNNISSVLNLTEVLKGVLDWGNVISTRKACLNDKYEVPFLSALKDARKLTPAVGGLTLSDASGNAVMKLKKR